jgi:lysophospholipase L1-like esterase
VIRPGVRCILQACALLVAGSASAERTAAPRPPTPRGHARERTEARAPTEAAAQAWRSRATLLVVGDSLVGGPFAFAKALREQLRERHVRVVQDTWVGVGTQRFASNRRFRDLVALYRPTHVFVVLGTNDYLLPAPEHATSAVERIAARAAAAASTQPPATPTQADAATPGTPRCAWIGPLVPKDTGIVRVIADHAAPCRFVDSRRFGVPTIRDGFHPSVTGAYLWADGVLHELAGEGWTWEP